MTTTPSCTPQCAWLTRHRPTLEHRRDLSAYIIRQPAFCRFDNAADLWQAALDITGGHPALIVTKLPPRMFDAIATLAHIRGPVPVIEPITLNHGYWTGDWRQSVPRAGGYTEWIGWTPDGVEADVREAIHERLMQDISGQPEPGRGRKRQHERHTHPVWPTWEDR